MNFTIYALSAPEWWEWWPAIPLVLILGFVAYGVDRMKH
jgi:hypothetical protein